MLAPRDDHSQTLPPWRVAPTVADVADLLLGTAVVAARMSGRLVALGNRVAAPALGVLLRPPLVPHRMQPANAVQLILERWRSDRPETLRTLGRWSASALPGAVDAAISQVDLERVVSVILDRLDVTQLVLDGVDLQRVVGGALEGLDLTAIVVEQVDLGEVVTSALKQVDLTQIVLQQVDLIGVAEYVVDGIDLPGIIRDSSGLVASQAVRGLRRQGADADEVLGRVVDRMLHRHGERRTEKAAEPTESPHRPAWPNNGKPE